LAHAVSMFVQPGHQVAELGSQLRAVSRAICQSLLMPQDPRHGGQEHGTTTTTKSRAVLVDVTRQFPKSPTTTEKKDRTRTRTNAMRLQSRNWVEIDQGNNRRRPDFFPSVATFYEMEQLDDWRTAFFFNPQKEEEEPMMDGSSLSSSSSSSSTTTTTTATTVYDVFVLDVNAIVGNDLEWTALSIIQEFEALNKNNHRRNRIPNNNDVSIHSCSTDPPPPLVVLVKSMALNQWATRLVNGPDWIQRRGVNRDTAPPYIIPTVGVEDYRSTIPATVQAGDAVLELGCHLGTSTALLHETAAAPKSAVAAVRGVASSTSSNEEVVVDSGGYCIGVDVGSKIVQGAMERYPHVYFRVGDAWRTAELLRIQNDYYKRASQTMATPTTTTALSIPGRRVGFDVVYVDVGGLSGNNGLLEAISLVSSIQHALEPRCIVIKSKCLRHLCSILTPHWQIQKQQSNRQGP
jgi:hypothetical protein